MKALARPESDRRIPTQKRAAAKVDHILSCTERLVAEHGIIDLSTNRIARAAKVSIGGIYRYFPDKEAIIVALYERALERMWALLQDLGADLVKPVTIDAVMDALEARIWRAAVTEFTPFMQLLHHSQIPGVVALEAKHTERVTAWITDILERVGTDMPRNRLENLAAFGYEIYLTAVERAKRLGGMDADLDAWQKLAVRTIFETALRPHRQP